MLLFIRLKNKNKKYRIFPIVIRMFFFLSLSRISLLSKTSIPPENVNFFIFLLCESPQAYHYQSRRDSPSAQPKVLCVCFLFGL